MLHPPPSLPPPHPIYKKDSLGFYKAVLSIGEGGVCVQGWRKIGKLVTVFPLSLEHKEGGRAEGDHGLRGTEADTEGLHSVVKGTWPSWGH